MSGSFIQVTGRLTRDPELTHVGGAGNAKLAFGVAFTHSFRKSDGEWEEETSFINVIAWRFLAENAMEVVKKGMLVTVTGRIQIRQYDKEDGTKATVTEIVADEIALSAMGIDSATRRPPKSSSGGTPAAPGAVAAPDEDPWANM